jgi:type III secretion system chaperone SycN
VSFGRGFLLLGQSFADRLGLPLRPARDGSLSFAFASTGTLSLTPAPDGSRVFVGLARLARRADGDRLRRALMQAGHQASTGRVVRVGLAADDSLHLVTDLADSELDLPSLDACLQELSGLHDRIA